IYWKNGKMVELYAADSARKREDLSYERWGKRLNSYLKYIEKTVHPDLFILGGGVSRKLDRFEKQIKIKTPYVAAKNLNNAGIIGAAVFAYEHVS
ncbi:MAG: ROK family protein, partial [Bacteroidia bacterium]|nr:ROK family protein [Bacteroidia bacterium]